MNSALITEINQIISKLPENTLESVLKYLKQMEKKANHSEELNGMITKIFEEDAELLKKLAQ